MIKPPSPPKPKCDECGAQSKSGLFADPTDSRAYYCIACWEFCEPQKTKDPNFFKALLAHPTNDEMQIVKKKKKCTSKDWHEFDGFRAAFKVAQKNAKQGSLLDIIKQSKRAAKKSGEPPRNTKTQRRVDSSMHQNSKIKLRIQQQQAARKNASKSRLADSGRSMFIVDKQNARGTKLVQCLMCLKQFQKVHIMQKCPVCQNPEIQAVCAGSSSKSNININSISSRSGSSIKSSSIASGAGSIRSVSKSSPSLKKEKKTLSRQQHQEEQLRQQQRKQNQHKQVSPPPMLQATTLRGKRRKARVYTYYQSLADCPPSLHFTPSH
jgi:hypothetical protein